MKASDECGFSRALTVIKGKWKSTIVWELHEHPIRFGELRRRLAGISEKMLYEQLRELEADGVVHREDHAESPPRVEYSLTEAGQALNEAAHRLAEWGERHAPMRPRVAVVGIH
jgi:DNA-binding HxlR family transcriptional regulator